MAVERVAKPAVRRPLRRHRPVDRQHAADRAAEPVAEAGRAHLGEARVAQPDGLGQGSRGARADRGCRGEGRDLARTDDPRTDVGQHGHLTRDDRQAQGLQAEGRDARERHARAHAAAGDVRRRDRLLAGRPGLQRRRRDVAARWPPKTPRSTCPTSTATRPTPTPTTTARRWRSSKSSTRSRRSSPGSARAAR